MGVYLRSAAKKQAQGGFGTDLHVGRAILPQDARAINHSSLSNKGYLSVLL